MISPHASEGYGGLTMTHSALAHNMVKHLPVQGGCFLQNGTVLKRRWEMSKRNGREEGKRRRREEEEDEEGAGENS